MSPDDLDRVRHILKRIEAADLAEAMAQRYPGDPDVTQVALDALRYHLSVIAEAVSTLSPDLRDDHPAVPWSSMARLGDLIGHRDEDPRDLQTVRAIIGEPVRRLQAACRSILGESVRIGEDEP